MAWRTFVIWCRGAESSPDASTCSRKIIENGVNKVAMRRRMSVKMP